jgi:hypothetical protein
MSQTSPWNNASDDGRIHQVIVGGQRHDRHLDAPEDTLKDGGDATRSSVNTVTTCVALNSTFLMLTLLSNTQLEAPVEMA